MVCCVWESMTALQSSPSTALIMLSLLCLESGASTEHSTHQGLVKKPFRKQTECVKNFHGNSGCLLHLPWSCESCLLEPGNSPTVGLDCLTADRACFRSNDRLLMLTALQVHCCDIRCLFIAVIWLQISWCLRLI